MTNAVNDGFLPRAAERPQPLDFGQVDLGEERDRVARPDLVLDDGAGGLEELVLRLDLVGGRVPARSGSAIAHDEPPCRDSARHPGPRLPAVPDVRASGCSRPVRRWAARRSRSAAGTPAARRRVPGAVAGIRPASPSASPGPGPRSGRRRRAPRRSAARARTSSVARPARVPSGPARPAAWPGPTTRSVASAPSGADDETEARGAVDELLRLCGEDSPGAGDAVQPIGGTPDHPQGQAVGGRQLQRGRAKPLGQRDTGGGIEANFGQERPSHAGFAEHQGVGAADQAAQRREPVGARRSTGCARPRSPASPCVMRSRTGPGTGRPS